jgi:hypothetical protein
MKPSSRPERISAMIALERGARRRYVPVGKTVPASVTLSHRGSLREFAGKDSTFNDR